MSGGACEARPRKAYVVERISRCVVTSLVYADSAADARRRDVEEGDAIEVRYEGRGYGRIRRSPEDDRARGSAPERRLHG